MGNISAPLYEATVRINLADGSATMTASVMLTDDVLGPLAGRTIVQDDPQIIAAVLGFIEQQLPSLEAKAGFPVTLTKPVVKDEAVASEVAIPAAEPQIIK